MAALVQDVRYALRMLGRNPGFTTVAALTIALGIGATTVIFTFVNAVIVRPLPYKNSEDLVIIAGERRGAVAFTPYAMTVAGYAEWESLNRTFAEMTAFTGGTVSLTGVGEPERLMSARVTRRFFETFGVPPIAGRTFLPEESRATANVAVIASSLWQRRFRSDPAIVGAGITLDGQAFTVVGVMPPGFAFPQDISYLRLPVEIWTPMIPRPEDGGNAFLQVVGRLKEGERLEGAQAEVTVVAQRLDDRVRTRPEIVRVVSLHERVVGEVRPLLLVFLGAVVFVLCIACTNVANLLLARSASRQKEVAIRTALGSGRWRLVRQFLTESVLLGLLGGAGGLLAAAWGADVVKSVMPPSTLPRLAETSIDSQTLAFVVAISFLTSVLFGIGPALRSTATDSTAALKETAANQTSGSRLLNVLVVAEVALAFVLLAGAGLLIRSFARLTSVDPGFKADSILTLSVTLPETPYTDSTQMRIFAQDVLDRLRSAPGVLHAGVINWLPLGGDLISGDFLAEGVDPMPRGLTVAKPAVSTDYFNTMGIPILRGRPFNDADSEGGQGVAIVTDQLARQLWPEQEVIGKRLKIGFGRPETQPWLTVVGVAGDVKQTGLGDRTRPAIYMTIHQAPRPFLLRNLTFVVRTRTDPAAVAATLRAEIRAVDPNLPFDRMETMAQLLADSVSEPRFRTLALGGFAAIALVLVATGVLGVLAYSVSRRTREIGVRMALGAQRVDVLKLVVRHALLMTLAGLALGMAGALALTKLLTEFLFNVRPNDPATLAAVSIVLLVVAALASYVPARRASSVDPLIALRLE